MTAFRYDWAQSAPLPITWDEALALGGRSAPGQRLVVPEEVVRRVVGYTEQTVYRVGGAKGPLIDADAAEGVRNLYAYADPSGLHVVVDPWHQPGPLTADDVARGLLARARKNLEKN